MNRILRQWARMGRVQHHNSISHPPFTFSMEHAQPKSQTVIFYVQPVLGITLTQKYERGGHMDTFSHMATLFPTLLLQPQGPQMMIQCMRRSNGVRSRYLT
jgi:hypothetical protein